MSPREVSSPPGLLVDTNIILDVILDRAPWAGDGALLLDAIARGKARGFVAGHAITTVHYIVAKAAGRSAAGTAVGDLLQLLLVVPLETSDFQRALALGLADYEGAVQVAACLRAGADYLVTRNVREYKAAPVVARAPGEIMGLLAAPRDFHG